MATEAYKKIAEMIREKRINIGWTQITLARKLGYKTSMFVSLIERGETKIPLETMGKLCNLLQIDRRTVIRLLTDEYQVQITEEMDKGRSQVKRNTNVARASSVRLISSMMD